MRKFFVLFLIACLAGLSGPTESRANDTVCDTVYDTLFRLGIPYPDEAALHSPLIDSLIAGMSLEDMAAQTIILRSAAKPTPEYVAKMRKLLQQYTFGGVCFFAGTTPDMLSLQLAYKKASRLPLFMTIDGEFGPGMRMTDLRKIPRQQTLGAIGDENEHLIYEAGREVGRQCRLLGLLWNYLPVADVNNNPLNPVINTRSFGEESERVARLAGLYLKGMQSQGILGSAKHFPGHGDTETDSHEALPLIRHSKQQMDSIHLLPFKKLIAQGVESMMVAHLNLPAYDSSGLPSSLSPAIVRDLLRHELGFRGLIVTDGLEMQGVRKALQKVPGYRDLGEGAIEVQALAAGCDVLLLPLDPEAAVKAIVHAVKKGSLSRKRVEEACRRILYYKTDPAFLQLYTEYPLSASPQAMPALLKDSLRNPASDALQQSLYNKAVTLIENDRNLIPISKWEYPRILCLNIGENRETEFARTLSGFDAAITHRYLHRDFNPALLRDTAFIAGLTEAYDLIIVGISHTNYLPARHYGITRQTVDLTERLQESGKPIILTVFAPPYALAPFYDMPCIPAVICGYQDVEESHRACANLIFGALPARGRLPVTVGKYWPAGHGCTTRAHTLIRGRAEDVGLDPALFSRIDSIARSGIEQAAYPGCQILIAKSGTIVYDQCFGKETYEPNAPEVTPNSLYDIASLTKIMATTLAFMRLYDNGVYRLDEPIRNFIPRLASTNKRHITFRQVLSHQSGLKAYLRYVEEPVFNGRALFDTAFSKDYPVQVADRLFVRNGFDRHIRRMIDESPVNPRRPYVYSDLGFYYLNEALRNMTDTTIEAYVEQNFYRYLGLENIGFHPLERFPISRIMPTEDDSTMRYRLIRGFVHDPLIALTGGAGGSAGLFSNSYDVAVIGQMLLQYGQYGGIRYIDSLTVKKFTSADFSPEGNRRGGGFDKPPLETDQPSPTCASASAASFGHSGFTGTYCWIDPETEIVYVFLSNRVYPAANNHKLSALGIRTAILECLYEKPENGDPQP